MYVSKYICHFSKIAPHGGSSFDPSPSTYVKRLIGKYDVCTCMRKQYCKRLWQSIEIRKSLETLSQRKHVSLTCSRLRHIYLLGRLEEGGA